MKTFVTVHALAVNDSGEYLVLQRATHRRNPGAWNCVTGYLQDRESAEEAALRELVEETNLEGEIIKTTEPFWIEDGDVRWVIISSLIKVSDTSEMIIDSNESQNYKWIKLDDEIVEKSEGLKSSLRELGIFPVIDILSLGGSLNKYAIKGKTASQIRKLEKEAFEKAIVEEYKSSQ